MMKSKKRVLLLLLSACMAFTQIPVSALAAGEEITTQQDSSNTITQWKFDEKEGYGVWKDGYLSATTSSWNNTYGTVSRYLPASITATIDGEEKIVKLENWVCTSPGGSTSFSSGGVYTYTADIESPYQLSDGTRRVHLKIYGDGWYLSGNSSTVPRNMGWNQEHTIYTITSQDNYPDYHPEYGVYDGAYRIYLSDNNEAVLNLTDTTWDTYDHSEEGTNKIKPLFQITGSSATIQGRSDTTYLHSGFQVVHPGETTLYLKDYKLTSKQMSQFSTNTMTLFSHNQEQTITIVYQGDCHLPILQPSGSNPQKLIFQPEDENSTLHIERIRRNTHNDFSVEFDGGKVTVESGITATAITVKRKCQLDVTAKVEGSDNFAIFQADEIVIDDAAVTVSAEGRNNNYMMYTMIGSEHQHKMVEGSSITIKNGSVVTVDSSNAPLLSSNSEIYFTGIGNAENIEILDSTVVVKQRNQEIYSSGSNYNLGTDASIGNVFKTLTIKNANITSDAYFGPAIGMGGSISLQSYNGKIVIEDSIIDVRSSYGAGIGIGYGDETRAAVDITIKGNSVVTARSVKGAGIGGAAKNTYGTDPDAVIIAPTIPGGWEIEDGGDLKTFSRSPKMNSTTKQTTSSPVPDSSRPDTLYTTGQTLTVETTENGTPQILAESGVCAIACETVTTDVTMIQNTTQAVATSAATIKVGEQELGTLRKDFQSIATVMDKVSEGNYEFQYNSDTMVNWSENVEPLYGNTFFVKEGIFNRFWAEPRQKLGGRVYIANSSTSSSMLTSSLTSSTLYVRTNTLTPDSATKTSPAPDKLMYQWYKDGVALTGKTTSSIHPTEPGLYSCIVSGENLYHGSLQTNVVTVYASGAAIPKAPKEDVVEKNSITIKASNIQDSQDTALYEYSIDAGVTWQDGLIFDGLEENTTYSIVRRVKDTDSQEDTVTPGPISEALLVQTLGSAPDEKTILDAIDYEKEKFHVEQLPEGVMLYRSKSTSTTNQIDVSLEGCLTSYIVAYGNPEKVLYAKFSEGVEWTTVRIPSRPQAPMMYPEDILPGTTQITITGKQGVAYNYAKKGEEPAGNTQAFIEESGKVVFSGLTSDTEYTIHARISASNEKKNFHSAQTFLHGKTLQEDLLTTTIYLPFGVTEERTYDLSQVLGEKNFDTLSGDGAVIAEASGNGKQVTLLPAQDASGTVTLTGKLEGGGDITIQVVISKEVVGENEDGTVLWMWKQDETDLKTDASAFMESGDQVEIGTSRRLVPIYASGLSAGKLAADVTTEEVLLPYWEETSKIDRWLFVYLQEDGSLTEITSLELAEDGIRLSDAQSGIYGLYTLKSGYQEIPLSVTVEAVYGTPFTPKAQVEEENFTPSDAAKWTYLYSTDGGETYQAEAPINAGTYYVKTIFLDLLEQRRGENVTSFEIAKVPLSVTANDHTIIYGDEPAHQGVVYEGFVNGENEEVLEGQISYDYSYEIGEDVGIYTITPKGITSSNYEITFVDGTLTVEKAIPTITWPSASAILYGQELSTSELSEMEWEWADDTTIPTVSNEGYEAVLMVDDVNYDYQGIEGYRSENHCIVRTIPVSVAKAETPLSIQTVTTGQGENCQTVITVTAGKSGKGNAPTGNIRLLHIINGVEEELAASLALGEDGIVSYTWNLEEEGSYTIKAIYDGNENYNRSETTYNFDSTKQSQEAPLSFTLTFTLNEDGETYTATIPAVEHGLYSFDGIHWSKNNTKTDCYPNTPYTGFVKYEETDTHNESAVTSDTQMTPKPQVEKPVITEGATFTDRTEVTITCDTSQVKIYYTLDGSDPTTASTEYKGTFEIRQSVTISAIAVREDGSMTESEISRQTFRLKENENPPSGGEEPPTRGEENPPTGSGNEKPSTGENKKPPVSEGGTKSPVEDGGTIVVKPGTEIKSKDGIYKFKIINHTEAVFTGVTKRIKTVRIANTVTYHGKKFKVTAVANKALKGDTIVTKLALGTNVESVGTSAFEGCTNLKKIVLKKKLKKIGDKALKNCKSLTKVTIPVNVIQIGKSALEGCRKLGKITIKSTKLKKVKKNAFKNLKANVKIKVPKKKIKSYKKLFKNKGLSKKAKMM